MTCTRNLQHMISSHTAHSGDKQLTLCGVWSSHSHGYTFIHAAMRSVNVHLQGESKQEASMKQAVCTALSVICNIHISCLAYSSTLKMGDTFSTVHRGRTPSEVQSPMFDGDDDDDADSPQVLILPSLWNGDVPSPCCRILPLTVRTGMLSSAVALTSLNHPP
jgi:hypothetical protein